ncbi:DUF4388 domain-containing protein [Geobacter sp. AOG2]|uniref:DUF4388 domain-containing protein n=1 Tax=Geobacter sp. AOG2 TaxID=1566347 RepID=UPI001CC627BC|nr:DUF4388 domain-containing protein [Geobacter sp. AOG2]GFE61977.1 hypothetical protein AOG2_25650 [Geobacter sp. AOG2]
MSLIGDLSQFPISDIIQFVHETRKSGTIRIGCFKGECNLVFSKGDIVSANYLNGMVRIGQILVHIGAITKAELAWALAIQEQDPPNRKPLVLTLLENSMVAKEAACEGLKMLIEMTLVEILSWDFGHYEFEECNVLNLGSWFYNLTDHQEVSLNARAALLESLRIFDEKRRDGTMDNILGIAGLDGSLPLLVEPRRFQVT